LGELYDFSDSYTLYWGNKPKDDLTHQFEAGAFDDGQKTLIEKLLRRMSTVMDAQKTVFAY
jgi:hypothetical protein